MSKRAALSERREKYVRVFRLDSEVEAAAADAILGSLARDYPDRFQVSPGRFVRDGAAIEWSASSRAPGAVLDLLARVVREDLVVVQLRDGLDQVVYLHQCSPSRWAAEDVIGRSFVETHVPVPGFGPVSRAGAGLMRAAIEGPPKVRFVWGLETDDRLNRHPEPPPVEDAVSWQGRVFTPDTPLFVRTERQTIVGLPEVGAFVFTILVEHTPEHEITDLPALIRAVEGMDPAQLAYKGLTEGRDAALARLRMLPAG